MTLSSFVAPPGRLQTYLESPEKETLPHSCTLAVYKNDVPEILRFCSRALRAGAGVKIILDGFSKQQPIQVNWKFYLSLEHPDHSKLTKFQQSKLATAEELATARVINVSDSMEYSLNFSQFSIEDSWEAFIELATEHPGELIVVDLSNLRPAGQANSLGLVATGPIGYGEDEGSFFSVYHRLAEYLNDCGVISLIALLGELNGTLRRGGQYKNGIITSSMPYYHPDFNEYINSKLSDLPGSHKKGVRLDSGVLNNPELVATICQKHTHESVFLEKIQPGNIYSNVCVGILLADRGTCLINRINIAQCKTMADIPQAMAEATLQLCEIHTTWRTNCPDKAGIFAPLEEDRQIAIDLLGLANALAQWDITYEDHVAALKDLVAGKKQGVFYSPAAWELAQYLAKGYMLSTQVADEYMDSKGLPKLDRIHTVEPSQQSAFKYQDLEGNTTCRNIDPPFNRRVRRVSETVQTKWFYHGKVEIARDLNPELHQTHWESWQLLMNKYGRPHTMSFDNWQEATPEWFDYFIKESPLQTIYYNFSSQVDQWWIKKQAPTASETEEVSGFCDFQKPGECATCAE